MPGYRITLEVRSRLATPLAADTLWGHLAWGLRWRDGEAALVDWLARYDAGEPPLVISDPMPAGFWPRPLLPAPALPDSRPRDREHDRRKELDRCVWVAHEDWAACAGDLSQEGVVRVLMGSKVARRIPETSPGTVMHAGINRFTGGTAQEGGGLLYSSDEQFHGAHTRYDVWAVAGDSVSELQALFEAGFSSGYGRDSATGAGDVRVVAVEARELPAIAGANAGIVLGPAVPASEDPAEGYFSVGMRAGRLGGDFATAATPSGSTERQKRPVHCLLRGSVVLATPPRPTFGRVLGGVHEDPAIRHYAMSLLLPCRLDDATLREARS